MRKVFISAGFLSILLVVLFLAAAGIAEEKAGNELNEQISPIPLLKILSKESKQGDKDIYVISLTHLDETNEIAAMYLENPGCLIVVIYKEGDERKFANQLYQYDVMIPRKEIRQYYIENAPKAEAVLEKAIQYEQRFKEKS